MFSKTFIGLLVVAAGLIVLQTWRLENTQAKLAMMNDRFATCKADYSNILEDVKDDAIVDNTPLDELLRPEWMFDSNGS